MNEKNIRKTQFENYLGKDFQIRFAPNISLRATLVHLNALNSRNEDIESFSVVFETDQQTEYYTQATVVLIDPDQNESMIFLVPIGPDKGGGKMQYEAVFN